MPAGMIECGNMTLCSIGKKEPG